MHVINTPPPAQTREKEENMCLCSVYIFFFFYIVDQGGEECMEIKYILLKHQKGKRRKYGFYLGLLYFLLFLL